MTERELRIRDTDHGQVLRCSVCRGDYVHVRATRKTELGVACKTGPDFHLLADCENGHVFVITFHQHKGTTYVSSSVLLGEVRGQATDIAFQSSSLLVDAIAELWAEELAA